MSHPRPRPEAPTMTIHTHEEYRSVLERIGELEDHHRNTARGLELSCMLAAVECYHRRQGQDAPAADPPIRLKR